MHFDTKKVCTTYLAGLNFDDCTMFNVDLAVQETGYIFCDYSLLFALKLPFDKNR